MKKLPQFLLASAMLLNFTACRNAGNDGTPTSGAIQRSTLNWDHPFIPLDSANAMVQSYLTSINYQTVDTNVRSFIVDANALRQYLTTNTGQAISRLKLVLAHNAEYIQSGQAGQPCGYSNEALTVILAGYNDAGDYVYAPDNKVLDFSMPCPKNCPIAGTAASDLFIN